MFQQTLIIIPNWIGGVVFSWGLIPLFFVVWFITNLDILLFTSLLVLISILLGFSGKKVNKIWKSIPLGI